MRVKELAEIFKISVDELMGLLENVGLTLTDKENSMVDSNTEKKLAKKFNVPYPFKSAKAKAPKAAPVKAVNIPVKPAEKKAAPVVMTVSLRHINITLKKRKIKDIIFHRLVFQKMENPQTSHDHWPDTTENQKYRKR